MKRNLARLSIFSDRALLSSSTLLTVRFGRDFSALCFTSTVVSLYDTQRCCQIRSGAFLKLLGICMLRGRLFHSDAVYMWCEISCCVESKVDVCFRKRYDVKRTAY